MHPHEKQLTALAQALQSAIDIAGQLPDELSAIKLRTANKLRLEINFVNSIAGVTTTATDIEPSGPLTHIMGEPINRRPPVEKQDLQPTDMEREKFIADRDNLYGQFLTLKNEQVYSRSKMPGGDAVVRAVAKKAGITNYADAKMNNIFIESIRKAIQAEGDLSKSLNDAADKLKL